MHVVALLCMISARLAETGPLPSGARHAAYAALTQQALHQRGQELQLVRLVSAKLRATSEPGGRTEHAGTLVLNMDVRHFGAPSYVVQRVLATVQMLAPPPHPPGDHSVRGALAAARAVDKFKLLAFSEIATGGSGSHRGHGGGD